MHGVTKTLSKQSFKTFGLSQGEWKNDELCGIHS